MSSFNRRFLLFLPVALAACGFTPVYGPGQGGSALAGRVTFDSPNTEPAYLLVRNLEERLGRAHSAAYHLELNPALSREGLGVTAAGEITRFSLIGRVDYRLVHIASGAVLATGDVENFTGYSATGTTVESLAAENDAIERLMTILSDQITVALYTADLPE